MKVIKCGVAPAFDTAIFFTDSPVTCDQGLSVSDKEPNYIFALQMVIAVGANRIIDMIEEGETFCGADDEQLAEMRASDPFYKEDSIADILAGKAS